MVFLYSSFIISYPAKPDNDKLNTTYHIRYHRVCNPYALSVFGSKFGMSSLDGNRGAAALFRSSNIHSGSIA